MGWHRVLWLCAAFGCTKTNPAKHCDDGSCIDPSFPFCDVSGAISGEPGSCIATTCSADQFVECRGDVELRCNADGTNYNLTPCDRGCDAAAGGCRLCEPGETACTNGQVATCDGTGAVVSSSPCPLGCFENEPRCREIDPSNGLAKYLDMVADPPDLNLLDATLTVSTGELTDGGVAFIDVPSFMVSANGAAPAVRVFVANTVNIQLLRIRANEQETVGPAVALLARGDIAVTGLVEVRPGVGRVSCGGGNGKYQTNCNHVASGGGGGGHATNGAKGGDVTNTAVAGGTAGIASGSPELVPLRGGCGGGGVPDGSNVDWSGPGLGGGAIQLSSRSQIRVDGIIDVRGGDAGMQRYEDQTDGLLAAGGGAGGGILLEAPSVSLDVNAQLVASGGTGAGLCQGLNATCGAGGAGAQPGTAAGAGETVTCTATLPATTAGGGGGGLGRVRINTRDGVYAKASSAVETAVTTAGTIPTR